MRWFSSDLSDERSFCFLFLCFLKLKKNLSKIHRPSPTGFYLCVSRGVFLQFCSLRRWALCVKLFDYVLQRCLRMDLRNLKKNLQAKSVQRSDSKSDLSSLAMSHLNSLPMNPFSQLNSVNMSQLLGKFGRFWLLSVISYHSVAIYRISVLFSEQCSCLTFDRN